MVPSSSNDEILAQLQAMGFEHDLICLAKQENPNATIEELVGLLSDSKDSEHQETRTTQEKLNNQIDDLAQATHLSESCANAIIQKMKVKHIEKLTKSPYETILNLCNGNDENCTKLTDESRGDVSTNLIVKEVAEQNVCDIPKESIETLKSMGFDESAVVAALLSSENYNMEEALNLLT